MLSHDQEFACLSLSHSSLRHLTEMFIRPSHCLTEIHSEVTSHVFAAPQHAGSHAIRAGMLRQDLTLSAFGARVRTLHSSGSSDVYACTWAESGEAVVVKRTKVTCPGDISRFEKELAMLLACEHARVIQPAGVVRAPPTYALALPLHERGALFGVLHASGRTLTPHAKLVLCADVAAALAHLHARGVLHRDVKSDNVLVHASGRGVLADFNAAEWEAEIKEDIVTQARPTGGFFKQFVVCVCAARSAPRHILDTFRPSTLTHLAHHTLST